MKLNFASTTDRLFGRDEELDTLLEIYHEVKRANRRLAMHGDKNDYYNEDRGRDGGDDGGGSCPCPNPGPMFVDLQASSGNGKTSLVNHFGCKVAIAEERAVQLLLLHRRGPGLDDGDDLSSSNSTTSDGDLSASVLTQPMTDATTSVGGDDYDDDDDVGLDVLGTSSIRTTRQHQHFPTSSIKSIKSIKSKHHSSKTCRQDVMARCCLKGKFNEQHQVREVTCFSAMDS